MISIHEKTMKEIHDELEFNLLNDIKKDICLTYIIDSDRVKINTDDLSEDQIISLIKDDLRDFFSPDGSYYKKNYRTRLDVLALAPLVRDKILPSVKGAYELYKLIPVYDAIIFKILNDFGYMNIIQRAIVIAKFVKETHDDFKAISYSEMIKVLQQMADNETEREIDTEMRLR